MKLSKLRRTDVGPLLSVESLGADFVRPFRRLTINYGRMFIHGNDRPAERSERD